MGDQPKIDVQALRNLQENLPEEDQKGTTGRILQYITDLLQTGWSVGQAFHDAKELSSIEKHLRQINRILDEYLEDEKVAIISALEYQMKNCSEAMNEECYKSYRFTLEELREKIAQGTFDKPHQDTKKLIVGAIKDYQREQSNKMIQNMITGSLFIAALQAVRVYVAWKKISAASNVIKDSEKFTSIRNNLRRMEDMVSELLDIHERNPNDDTIPRKMMRINTMFTSTLAKISDLRVKIDGHIQRLDVQGDYLAADGVVNAITAGTHAFQVWNTWDHLSSLSKFLGFASVAIFTAFGAADAKLFFLTQEKLNELRKDLRETIRLQEMLQDLHDRAAEAIQYDE